MSGVVFGCVVPHPPIMVPLVGGSEVARISSTVAAMKVVSAALRASAAETLVVVSPHGPIRRSQMGVSGSATSLGDLARFGARSVAMSFHNDLAFVSELHLQSARRGIPLVVADGGGGAYELDHGVVAPMSYLRDALPEARLVPVTFSFLPLKDHFAFGQAIAAASESVGRRTAVIASGDLSHRLLPEAPAGYDPKGSQLDAAITGALAAADAKALINLDLELIERGGECGLRSFVILLGALDGQIVHPRLLSYEGPFGVGYAVAHYEVGSERARPAEAPAADPDRDAQGANGDSRATDLASVFVSLARSAVERYVAEGHPILVPGELPPPMKARAGVFVCIKKAGALRGCIGTFEPTRTNVAEELIHNAISAATRDPRFLPVSREELGELTYSVDVLTPPEAVGSAADLDPRRYGVIVSSGHRRGLLLPDLAGVDTVERQVEIARQKAGIGPKEPLQLHRFSVERYALPGDDGSN